jgi:hypothetical protein
MSACSAATRWASDCFSEASACRTRSQAASLKIGCVMVRDHWSIGNLEKPAPMTAFWLDRMFCRSWVFSASATIVGSRPANAARVDFWAAW